jgi:hypothetical protein
MGSQGEGCSSSGRFPLSSPPTGGPVTITQIGSSYCGAGGARGGLSVIRGCVYGAGAATVEVQFANAAVTGGPIQNGRFAVAAAQFSAVCAVRALDANGSVLAEEKLGNGPGQTPALGTCP